MNRETTTIKTLGGKDVVIKTYLSAREMQAINLALVGEKQADVNEGGKVQIPISAGIEWEKNIIKTSLVSFNSIEQDPIEAVLDLPNEDYTDLKNKIFEILKINLGRTK